MSKLNVTRGYGLLEEFLAKQRSTVANNLIPLALRKGRLLDIGCGTYPLFLVNTPFSEKYGLDKIIQKSAIQEFQNQGIVLINHDLENEDLMFLGKESFDVVTMLGVFEHVESKRLSRILKEINQLLRPGGIFIITTPNFWTDKLLKIMVKFGLISSIEINEHKDAYSHSRISLLLQQAEFSSDKLHFGYFEMFMNIWVTATK